MCRAKARPINFTDLNGERHTHEATGSSNVPNNCQAKAKEKAVENVQALIQKEGFTNVSI